MFNAPLASHHNDNGCLHSLTVRPVKPTQRSRWDELMSSQRYLGFKSLVGESIRYIAELRGRWVALLGWSSAALKCHPRDAWIGWPQVLQWKRLYLVNRGMADIL